jgi:hypothetical protein
MRVFENWVLSGIFGPQVVEDEENCITRSCGIYNLQTNKPLGL